MFSAYPNPKLKANPTAESVPLFAPTWYMRCLLIKMSKNGVLHTRLCPGTSCPFPTLLHGRHSRIWICCACAHISL